MNYKTSLTYWVVINRKSWQVWNISNIVQKVNIRPLVESSGSIYRKHKNDIWWHCGKYLLLLDRLCLPIFLYNLGSYHESHYHTHHIIEKVSLYGFCDIVTWFQNQFSKEFQKGLSKELINIIHCFSILCFQRLKVYIAIHQITIINLHSDPILSS